nr:unnamed protein product [Digitaria exilis]
MASITLLSLAPTATFLHIPASSSSSSSLVAAPGILTGQRAAPRAHPLRARPPRRVTVVCSGAAAEASDTAAPTEKNAHWVAEILGDGDVSVKLNIKAGAFSASAKEKLEAAGCNLTLLPKRKKWLSQNYLKNQARAEEYFAKKKGGAGESDGTSV